MADTWTRMCVIRYVKDVRDYEARQLAGIERAKKIRAQLEGVGAVRYDTDGSRAGWTDRRPEALDTLDRIAESLEADIALWAEEAENAHRIFDTCPETRMVWEHWGRRATWAACARMTGYSYGGVRKASERGIEIIWHMMPEEYRRSPYPAEPWENRGSL